MASTPRNAVINRMTDFSQDLMLQSTRPMAALAAFGRSAARELSWRDSFTWF